MLAAGLGRRLFGDDNGELPKSLLRFDGVTLLARHVDALVQCGATGLTVVVGHRHEDLRAELKDTAVLGWLQGLAVTERPACDMSDYLDRTYAGVESVHTDNWPFFRKTLAEILVPKLKLLGLLDKDLVGRLRDAGCPVPVLEKAAIA